MSISFRNQQINKCYDFHLLYLKGHPLWRSPVESTFAGCSVALLLMVVLIGGD
jgi:hypothetical protein